MNALYIHINFLILLNLVYLFVQSISGNIEISNFLVISCSYTLGVLLNIALKSTAKYLKEKNDK